MALQNIGRYRILRELGRGATATVYLARDPGSGRQVAVKILSAAYTAAPDFPDRFEQTLAALAGLDHPYLVMPQDHGRDADQYFVVMRYLPGGTLADRMDGRPMLLAEVVPILQRLSEALDAAHTAHLLHGDLHPADVLFDLRERAFLSDLGLAQLLDPVAGPSPIGTAAYMSPEQIAGQPIDGRADVYALGIMLFEMLTGRQPFAGPAPQDLLRQHLEQPVPQLSSAALAHLVLPLEFNLVIARALAKNRDYRYPTAGVLAEAVRTMFLMAPADSAQEAPPAEPPKAAVPPPLVPPPAVPLPVAPAAAPPPVPQPPPAPVTPEPGPADTAAEAATLTGATLAAAPIAASPTTWSSRARWPRTATIATPRPVVSRRQMCQLHRLRLSRQRPPSHRWP
jgi:serine/threonine protein kinase